MAQDNAMITLEVSGIGWKKQRTVKGRVTAKRITTADAVWDRNGARIGKTGMYHYRFISFEMI